MQFPVIYGRIDRRILINFSVEPEVAARLLPAPFEPLLVRGRAVAGICLIRLDRMGPKFWPAAWGMASENAAHRWAVEWPQGSLRRQGVFIPRRDTSSRFNVITGGRVFPGVHHHARFRCDETPDGYRVAFTSDDGGASVAIEARRSGSEFSSRLFDSLAQASTFFERGACGCSPSKNAQVYERLQLECDDWRVAGLDVARVESSYFNDRSLFPAGSVEFDSALVMHDVTHHWVAEAPLVPEKTCT